MKAKVALLLALAVVLVSSPAFARKGFYIGTGGGLAVPYHSGDIDELNPETGRSLELIHLGYNFTDVVGISWQWGAATGPLDDIYFDNERMDASWGISYMDLGLRLNYDHGSNTSYFEGGFGTYFYDILDEDADYVLSSDPVVGYRLAVGTNFYLGGFYIGPEISYHISDYKEGKFDPDDEEIDVDFDTNGNTLMIMLKLGYHWIRD